MSRVFANGPGDSIPKSKFRKILVENITIIAHEIIKQRLQILEALHIKKTKINRINFENSDNICKQPPVIASERSENARDNFGKSIHQFQPETQTLIRKLERILIKLYWQNVSLLFI